MSIRSYSAMQPLPISVVGAGYWGRKVIREILSLAQTTRRVSLHSVVDNSPSTLEQCRKEFGSLKYRLNYGDLLSDSEASAVHICSPNPTHFEVASELLRSRKDVLVEKPLALRAREAYELVRLAETNRRVLSTGHVHRFNNGVTELKRVVDSGVLGDIYYLRLNWTGFLPPQKDRDVITDLGPHPFDICNNVLGEWPTKITCKGKGYRTRTSDEVAFITAEYLDGVVANIELSWLDRERRREVTVVGSDAVARLDCLDQRLVLRRSDSSDPVSVVQSNTVVDAYRVRNLESNIPEETVMPRSLAELFERASKDLIQIKGDYGFCDGVSEACAEGAIFYYRAKSTFHDYNGTLDWARCTYIVDNNEAKLITSLLIQEAMNFEEDLILLTGKDMSGLNDRDDWSFADFARAARELGY